MSIKRILRFKKIADGVQNPIEPPPEPTGDAPYETGEHPKIFVTTEGLDTLAARAMAMEAASGDLTEMANYVRGAITFYPMPAEPEPFITIWKIFDASLLALLHTRLVTLGYTFHSTLDTPQKCATIAYLAATAGTFNYLAQLRDNNIPVWDSDSTTFSSQHGYMREDGLGKPGWTILGCLYDWCKPYLDTDQKQDLLDTYSLHFDRFTASNYAEDLFYPYQSNISNDQQRGFIIQNQHIESFESINWHLAFANDADLDTYYSAKAASVAHRMWNQQKAVFDDFFAEGYFGYEAAAGYSSEDSTAAVWHTQGAQTAFDENLIRDTPFFNTFDRYYAALAMTSGLSIYAKTSLINSGTINSNSMTISAYEQFWLGQAMAGAGLATEAGVLKYMWTNWNTGGTDDDQFPRLYPKSPAYVGRRITSGHWNDTALVNPDDVAGYKAGRLGMGCYYFRSGFDAASSKMHFFAGQIPKMGHSSINFARFDISKQGHLILGEVGNGKNGGGEFANINPTAYAFFYSGCHVKNNSKADVGGSTPSAFRTSGTGWAYPSNNLALGRWGILKTSPNPIKGEKYDDQSYGYVWYDMSSMVSATTHGSSGQNCEFIYIDGDEDHEYVIRLDRAIVSNTSTFTRKLNLWTTVEPAFENGSPSSQVIPCISRATGYIDREVTVNSSTTVTKMSITNEGASTSLHDSVTGPRDGKAYLTFVDMPANYTVEVGGGDYVEYAVTSWTEHWPCKLNLPAYYPGTPAQQFLGWGRIQVLSATTEDPYLTVFQIGKASTMSSQVDVTKVTSADTVCTGSHIQDADNEWVVMFARGYANSNNRVSTGSFTVTPVSGTLKVLWNNMQATVARGVTYAGGTVTVAATGGTTVSTNGNGTLEFTINTSTGAITSGV